MEWLCGDAGDLAGTGSPVKYSNKNAVRYVILKLFKVKLYISKFYNYKIIYKTFIKERQYTKCFYWD